MCVYVHMNRCMSVPKMTSRGSWISCVGATQSRCWELNSSPMKSSMLVCHLSSGRMFDIFIV